MTISGGITVASTSAFGALVLAQETIAPPGSPMDPTLFAAAIVTVIAALGGVTVQIINSVSSAHDRREAAVERRALFERTNAAASKTDTLIEKTAEIHTLTNSTNSNLQKALDLMTEKNLGLERALAQANATKKETAARQAVIDAQHGSPPGSVSVPIQTAETILASIDQNTAAIDENTKRTQADVQDLKQEKP